MLFILLVWLSVAVSLVHGDPLLVGCVMVKNEEKAIRETLESLFEAGITNFVVADTGSTDDTINQAKFFFKDYNVTGYISESPFIDFATSRNQALAFTESKFPDLDFIIMPDAEWFLMNASGMLLNWLEDHIDIPEPCIHVKIGTSHVYYSTRIFRKGVRYAGVVHEVPVCSSYVRLEGPYFEQRPTEYGVSKSRKRWERDAVLLHNEIKKNPFDSRSTFYLAQSYDGLNDLANASYWYTRRCQMPDYVSERFVSHFRLGQTYEKMGRWDLAIQAYLNGTALVPTRIECLIKLAEHYWQQDNKELAYMFTARAIDVPQTTDILFVEQYMYDYTRYSLLSMTAWYVGKYEEGYQATLKALEVRPDLHHLNFNLNIYLNTLHGN